MKTTAQVLREHALYFAPPEDAYSMDRRAFCELPMVMYDPDPFIHEMSDIDVRTFMFFVAEYLENP